MRRIRAWLVRLPGLFNKERRDRELAEELESHLQLHIESNLRSGMTSEEARRHALIKLGGIEPTKEYYRDRRGVPVLETISQDVRYGLRVLRKNPGFTVVAVLTLALGIGANAAIFSLVNAVLLRALPYPQASRLVLVWATNTKTGRTQDVASYPDFDDWRAQSQSFDGLAAFTTRGMILSVGSQTEMVPSIEATPGLFEMLRVLPAMGRTFISDEGEIGAPHVAILSDAAWKGRFAGRPDILGQTIRANEETYSIIGVMPPAFRFHPDQQEQIYVPLTRDPDRSHGFLRVVGRLRPGVSISQAQSEMNAITERAAAEYSNTNRYVGANVEPLVDALVGNVRTGLLILLGVVALVLLIACTNVANLMLARSASRQKEFAVRAALGAGRRRLAQQLLAESTILSLAGGALGLLLSSVTARLLAVLLSKQFQIPRIESTGTDARVLGFTFVISVAAGILFGAAAALSTGSADLNQGLREASRSATESTRGRRTRGLLVITETALALVLLVAAGLLLKSFLSMQSTPPGFETGNRLAVAFRLPRLKFGRLPDRLRFFDELLSSVKAAPGVRSAALVANLPLGGGSDTMAFHIPGRPDPAPGTAFSANFNMVSAGYFQTMGIPLSAGREFIPEENSSTPAAIVINESAAREFWRGEDPLGRQISLPWLDKTSKTLTVAGVTGDVRQFGLGTRPKPEIFLNCSMQANLPWVTSLALVAHTEGDALAMSGTVKSVAAAVDTDVPVTSAQAMEAVVAGSLGQPRAYTLLVGVFALLAVSLASVGLYGVVSYTVTQRTHEMGIHMALGAQRRDVFRLVLRQGLGLTIAGVAIGLAGALAAGRVLTSLVANVRPGDPLTLAAAAALLLTVALVAVFFPARRATNVDPADALRCE